MTVITTKRHLGLPLQARHTIEDFQRYILAQHHAHSPKWLLAQNLIQRIAEVLVEALDIQGPRVMVEGAARLLDVNLKFISAERGRSCGRIEPTDQGFLAVISRGSVTDAPLNVRERFTIAHECGHTFFYHMGATGKPRRIIPKSPGGYRESRNRESGREEGLCDAFARALLMPSKWVAKFTVNEPSADNLLSGADYFKVSTEAFARRVLYDFRGWATSIFFRVDLAGNELDVHPFLGKRSESVLSSKKLKWELAGKQPADILHYIQQRFSLRSQDIVRRGSAIWFRL